MKMTNRPKVYWMEVSGGEAYRNTFWFTSSGDRRRAYEMARWLFRDDESVKIKLGNEKADFRLATVRRMLEQGLTSPYQRRGKSPWETNTDRPRQSPPTPSTTG